MKSIVWAIDPFEGSSRPMKNVVEVIRRLRQKSEVRIFPVHVLSPSELNLSAEFSGPWISEYMPAAEKAMNTLLSQLNLTLEAPKVLTQYTASTAQAAEVLADYAEQIDAGMILVGSHGRTGVKRLLLGSFAETLLLHSRLPVLTVGPHLREEFDPAHVLFPTEFSDQSKVIFRRVVEASRDLGARITLFHAIPRPVEPVYQSGVYLLGSPWIPVHEYYTEELKRQQRRANAWARWAQNQGVHTEVIVDTEISNVSEAVLKVAQTQQVGWIAMEAHSGPIAAALLGSVTRQVVRHSDCPVWVMRWPKSVKSRKAPPKAA